MRRLQPVTFRPNEASNRPDHAEGSLWNVRSEASDGKLTAGNGEVQGLFLSSIAPLYAAYTEMRCSLLRLLPRKLNLDVTEGPPLVTEARSLSVEMDAVIEQSCQNAAVHTNWLAANWGAAVANKSVKYGRSLGMYVLVYINLSYRDLQKAIA